MSSSARFRLHLLGRPTLTDDDDSRPLRLTTRKVVGLLTYLAMSREHVAGREELAAMLWGGCSDQKARQSLRQALVLLRKDMRSSDIIQSEAGAVRLQPGALWVDAREFESLSKSSDPEDLERAARLFGGDFLAGLNLEEEGFEEWLSGQRLRMQLAASRMCETFATRPELVKNGEVAVGAAEQLVALDPLREDWQRLALTLLARYRSRNEALAQADTYAALLRRELGVAPDKLTRDLVERIRDAGTAPAPAPSRRADAEDDSGARPGGDQHGAPRAPTSITSTAAAPSASKPWGLRAVAAGVAIALTAGVALALLHDRPPSNAPNVDARETASIGRGYWRSPSMGEAAAAKSLIPIIVLPFTTFSDGETSAGDGVRLVAEMITDDLTNILSRNRSFRVISRHTARNYRGKPLDIPGMRAELQVTYVLEGSVRLQGDKLRVNVELIDAANNTAAWSGRVERDGGDRSGVQDEIVARLARELHFEILPIESARRRNDPDADALVYRGWAAMNTAFAKTGPGEFKKAESLFLQALERDPLNLQAKIGLGAYHANVGAQVLNAESKSHLEKAREILSDVLARAPNNGNAPFYLGLAHGASGQLEEAVAAFTRAVDANPSHASAHAHIGHALARMGRATEGLEHLQYAMRLSPRDPNLSYWFEFIGSAELALDRYPEAIENFVRSSTLNPGYPRGWAGLAAAHALSGNLDEARKHADKLKTFAPQADTEALIRRFGRNRKHSPKLHEGLRLALTIERPCVTPDPLAEPRWSDNYATFCAPPSASRSSAAIAPAETGRLNR